MGVLWQLVGIVGNARIEEWDIIVVLTARSWSVLEIEEGLLAVPLGAVSPAIVVVVQRLVPL